MSAIEKFNIICPPKIWHGICNVIMAGHMFVIMAWHMYVIMTGHMYYGRAYVI